MTICCLPAILKIKDCVQDGGHFIAETENGHKLRSTPFSLISINQILSFFNPADASLFSYNNLMFQDGIQNGC